MYTYTCMQGIIWKSGDSLFLGSFERASKYAAQKLLKEKTKMYCYVLIKIIFYDFFFVVVAVVEMKVYTFLCSFSFFTIVLENWKFMFEVIKTSFLRASELDFYRCMLLGVSANLAVGMNGWHENWRTP